MKRWTRRASICGLMFVVAIAFSIQPISAEAVYEGDSKIVHKGKYYFKFDYGKGRACYSKKKKTGFKPLPIYDNHFITNGNSIIYLQCSKKGAYIKQYTISSKKKKTIRKLPKAKDWESCAVSGDYLWLNKLNGSRVGCSNGDVYRYAIKKNKLTLKKKNCRLVQMKDNYCIGRGKDKMESLQVYNKMMIYRLTKDGKIKKVRNLGNVISPEGQTAFDYYYCSGGDYCLNCCLVEGYDTFYYATKHKVYRVKYNGKGWKLIKSFKGKVEWCNRSCCGVYQNGRDYNYTYKTKKWEAY